MALLLGIDTGGTYTDAVLFDDSVGIMAKAKALTTRHDLAIGISGAVDRVLTQSGKAQLSLNSSRFPPRSPPTRWSKDSTAGSAL